MDRIDTLERLKADGYEIVEEFSVNDTMKFVAKQYSFKALNVYTWLFLVVMFLCGIVFGVMVGINLEEGLGMSKLLVSFTGSILASLLLFMIVLVPIHEMLHGYGFKKCGAKRLKYGIIWSSLAFYCAAYDFVANYKQFRFIGLLPNVVINLVLLITFVCGVIAGWSLLWQFIVFFILFLHASGGMGDMALVGYLYKHRKEDMVTYDDMDKQISYMLVRRDKEC